MATERFWTSRLRWRLRGAWMWPAFALALIGDGLILHLLLIGALAPWLARRLIRREGGAPSLPPEVILDRTATFLMAAGAVGLVAVGLATRPLVVAETEAVEEAGRVVRGYVSTHAPEEIKRRVDALNSERLADGYFRSCVPYVDARRAYCMFVDTNRDRIRKDPSTEPNQRLFR